MYKRQLINKIDFKEGSVEDFKKLGFEDAFEISAEHNLGFEKLIKQILKHLPESELYLELHDFNFYKMSITNVRWIGGFGKIGWLNNDPWLKKDLEWIPAEKEIIEHMNQDHSKSIISTLSAQHNLKDKKAKMIELNIDGFYCESHNKIYFLNFKRPCFTVDEIRKELIVQARENRAHET